MTRHELKIWPCYLEPKLDGRKPWEHRQAIDRKFNEGDEVAFREWCPTTKEYTGRATTPAKILYVLRVDEINDIFTHEPVYLLEIPK